MFGNLPGLQFCYPQLGANSLFPSKRRNSRKIWPETSQTHECPFLPKE